MPPAGVAVCSQPDRRTRIDSGTDSWSSVVPAAHSPPTPNPARKREQPKRKSPVANPPTPVKTEYTRIVKLMTRTRPIRSASQPQNIEHAQPSMKMLKK